MGPLMKRLGHFCAIIVLLFCFAPLATAARDLTETESAKLAETVKRFDAAMAATDFGALVKTIPPRILQYLAKKGGGTEEQMSKAIADAMAEAFATVSIASFAMKLPEADHRELSDGTPYLFIPTETVVAVKGGDKILVRSQTLAMMDENEWYLLRTSDAQQTTVLIEVYPEYKGIEFPGDSTEILKE